MFQSVTFAGRNEGINVSYECLGGNDYLITVNLFRDCAEFNDLPNFLDVFISSSCQFIGFEDFELQNNLEVSQLCPDSLPFSSCNGGTLPGVELFVFQEVVNLPPCDDWQIIVAEQNRAEVLNLDDPDGDSRIHIESFLNNSSGECNSSPQLGLKTLPFVCANSPFFYNLSFTDPDGDSLAYALTPAITSPQNDMPMSMNYEAGFSPTAPIANLDFDAGTGQMNITPDQEGKYTIVLEVKEFRDGVLIGTVYFDFNVIVISCPVPPPVPLAGTLMQVSGGGYPITENQVGICAGDDFCLQLDFSSTDPELDLTLAADIAEDIPGATFTQIGTNPATIELCGTLPPDFTNGDFVVSARDNFCPIFGQAFYAIEFVIREPLVASSDTTVCAGESVTLNAENDISYTWYDLGGDQIPVNGAFSCNPCKNPVTTVDTTISFVVQGAFVDGICASRDTVTIQVPLSTDISVSPETCFRDDGVIDIAVLTGSGDLTVTWTDDPITDLLREGLDAGNYSVSIADNVFNCLFTQTFTVENLVQPIADAGGDDFACGMEYQLSAVPSFGLSQWTSDAPEINVSDPNLPNATVNSSTPGVYELVWTEDDDQGSGNGCIDSDTLTIEFFENPNAIISSVDSICGLAIEVEIDNPLFSSSWETSQNITIVDNGSSLVQAKAVVQGSEEIIYFSTNGPCVDSDTIQVVFIEIPIADAGVSAEVCGLEFQLSANPSVGEGMWTFPPQISSLDPANQPNVIISSDEYGFYELIWREVNQNYCLDEATVEIGFIEQPIIQSPNDTAFCGLQGSIASSVSVGNITWESGGDVAISDPNSSEILIEADFGVYNLTLIADNGFGCEETEQVQVTFLEQPIVNALEEELICGLETEVQAPTVDFNWNWISPELSLSSATDEMVSVVAAQEGEFDLEFVVDNQEVCFDTVTFRLTFFEQPEVIVSEDFSVCGTSTSIEATYSAGELIWTSGSSGVAFSNSNSPITNLTVEEFGGYEVFVEEVNGICSSKDSVVIDFQPPAEILNPTFSCTGIDANYQLSFNVSGDLGNGYAISGLEGELMGSQFISGPLESGTEINLTLSNFSICEAASFQGSQGCPVVSFSGEMTSDTIRVCGDQNAIADQLAPPELDGNDVLRYILHDSESSAVGTIFEWSEIPVFSFEDPLVWGQVYYISPVVGNPQGVQIDLNNPQVSVGAGQPVIFLQDPQAIFNYNEVICPSEEAIIEVDFVGDFPQLFTYIFDGEQSSVEVNQPSIELIFSDSGVVEPISISSQFCVGQTIGSAVITYHPEPTLDVNWDAEICIGESTQIEVDVEGEAPFTFSFGAIGEEIDYEISADTSFQLAEGGSFNIFGFADQLCPLSDQIEILIEQFPLPAVDAGEDAIICNGDTISIGSAPQPDNNYAWLGSDAVINPSSGWTLYAGQNSGSFPLTEEIILEVEDEHCQNRDTIFIEVFPQPDLQIFAESQICKGDSLQVVGFGATQLRWEPSQLFSNPDSSESFFYTEVSSEFDLFGQNEAGCSAKVSQEISVVPLPSADFTVSDQSGCAPLLVDLNIELPSQDISYQWTINSEQVQLDAELPQVVLDKGTYQVRLASTSMEGCMKQSEEPVRIDVFDVSAEFNYLPENPSISNPEVRFYSSSENAQLLFWQIDSLTTGEGEFFTFNFPTDEGASYEICLDAISPEGCVDSLCSVITIDEDFFIYVPTAFTPDGDGLNDLFFPQLSNIDVAEYRFWITNRSGQVVFETIDPLAKWDGSENNSSYFGRGDLYQWHIEARPDFNLGERFYTGMVMLIR